MGGKELVRGYVKDGFTAGALAVDRVVRLSENAPVAGRLVELGRQVVYMAGTKVVFDRIVRDERQDMRHQIRGDMVVAAMRGMARRQVPRETMVELDALLRYMDIYGPKTYDEYQQITQAEGHQADEFPLGQLVRLVGEAERRQQQARPH